MKTEDGIFPFTALKPACQRFLDEKLDDPIAYQDRLDALTMVHTVMVFADLYWDSRERKRAWFPRNSRRRELSRGIRFGVNDAGLVVFKDRMDLPARLVWEAAVALRRPENVSPLEADGFTVRLLDTWNI